MSSRRQGSHHLFNLTCVCRFKSQHAGPQDHYCFQICAFRPNDMSVPLKLGYVGYGGSVRNFHLPFVRAVQEVEVYAFLQRSEAPSAEERKGMLSDLQAVDVLIRKSSVYRIHCQTSLLGRLPPRKALSHSGRISGRCWDRFGCCLYRTRYTRGDRSQGYQSGQAWCACLTITSQIGYSSWQCSSRNQ